MGNDHETLHILPGRRFEEHASLREAREAGRKYSIETLRDPLIASAISQRIERIDWSATHFSLHMSNQTVIPIVATPDGPALATEPPEERSDPPTVELRFERESVLWNRQELFSRLAGSTLKHVQVSPDLIAMNTSGCESILFSVLLIKGAEGKVPFILYWGLA